MSEQELVRALQELIAKQSPPAEPRRLSTEILFRDRQRVRLLAGVTALLWLGGIAGVLYMIFWFNRFIVAYQPWKNPKDAEVWQSREFHAKMELHHSLEACMAAVPALLLAALGTVWLVFSSRRATLNQINQSLAEISEQLRQMRQLARPPDGERIVPR
jgi:H+/Cl- antiporter ClcA